MFRTTLVVALALSLTDALRRALPLKIATARIRGDIGHSGSRVDFTSLRLSNNDNNDDNTPAATDESSGWLAGLQQLPGKLASALPGVALGGVLGALLTLMALFYPVFSDIPGDGEGRSYDAVMTPPSAAPEAPKALDPKAAEVSRVDKQRDNDKRFSESVTLFADILNTLRTGYVDDVNPTKLFETAVSAMLKSLDPYTEYENGVSARNMQESVTGKYGGVGMVISSGSRPPGIKATAVDAKAADADSKTSPLLRENKKDESSSDNSDKNKNKDKDGRIIVVDAFESYAYDAGLRAGDRLLRVNGVDTKGLAVEEVKDLLRGEAGTDAVVEYNREGEPGILRTTIERKNVRLSDVKLATFLGPAKDGVGYINLSGFNGGAAEDFRVAFSMLKYSAPQGLKGLVLDLRGNPGGLLDAAVEVASYLVPAHSDIVSARSKNQPEITYRSTTNPIRPEDMKLVVLVNSGSASASEIVAGAVQDLDAGVILGPSRTFGKGLVQKIIPLQNTNSALKFTIAKYYTPSGRCIQSVRYLGGRDMPLVSSALPPTSAEGAAATLGFAGGSGDVVAVADSERSTFYTRAGRPVRDGGGVEPDVTVPAIKDGPSQGLFTVQGLYFDFISSLLAERPQLREGMQTLSQAERSARAVDFRFRDVQNSYPALAQFLVLPSREVADAVAAAPPPDVFKEFKSFVSKRLADSGVVARDTRLRSQLDTLSTELTELGVSSASKDIRAIEDGVSKFILADMETRRDAVVNDIEFALYSRELPDRIMIYKNVVQDPQVAAAVQIIAGHAESESVEGGSTRNSGGVSVAPASLTSTDREYGEILRKRVVF